MKTITQGIITVITMLAIESAFGQNLLQFTSARATVDGAIQMNWSSVSNAIYEIDYANALSDSGTQWNPLYINYTSQGTNTLFMDAGVYYQPTVVEHPRNFPERFYRVIQTGTNDVDPPVVAVTSPTNGNIASGLLNISMSATGSLPIAQVHIFVDGEEVRVSAAGDTNFSINTCEWPNGPHIIYAVADGISGALSSPPPTNSLYTSGASPFVQVQFNNFISQYTFSQSFFRGRLAKRKISARSSPRMRIGR